MRTNFNEILMIMFCEPNAPKNGSYKNDSNDFQLFVIRVYSQGHCCIYANSKINKIIPILIKTMWTVTVNRYSVTHWHHLRNETLKPKNMTLFFGLWCHTHKTNWHKVNNRNINCNNNIHITSFVHILRMNDFNDNF